MTSMKLQKLLYYVQAWSLALTDRPAFDDPIEAWAQGPVIERVYRSHRGQLHISEWPGGDAEALDERLAAVVSDVVDRYGDLSGNALSDLTHQELPWRQTRVGLEESQRSRRIIPNDLMKNSYASRAGTQQEAVDHALANAALEGVDLDEDFAHSLRDMVAGRVGMRDLIDRILLDASTTR